MLVYTTGNGVHGFTLNRRWGEFILSHPNIRTPPQAKYYSVNTGNERFWTPGVLRYMRYLQGGEEESINLSCRYIGSLVADFHRNLLAGGVFCYPADRKDPKKPHGKLRLLYEAAPLAMIAEQVEARLRHGPGAGADPGHPARSRCISACRCSSAIRMSRRKSRSTSRGSTASPEVPQASSLPVPFEENWRARMPAVLCT